MYLLSYSPYITSYEPLQCQTCGPFRSLADRSWRGDLWIGTPTGEYRQEEPLRWQFGFFRHFHLPQFDCEKSGLSPEGEQ